MGDIPLAGPVGVSVCGCCIAGHGSPPQAGCDVPNELPPTACSWDRLRVDRWHTATMRRGALRLAAGLSAIVLTAAGCDLATLTDRSTPPESVAPSESPSDSPSPDASAPPTESSPGTSGGPGASGALPTPEHYTVLRGDTLTRIAKMFSITVPQLLAANPQVQDPNSIRAGNSLTIPPRDSLAVAYRGGGGPQDTERLIKS